MAELEIAILLFLLAEIVATHWRLADMDKKLAVHIAYHQRTQGGTSYDSGLENIVN